MEEQSPIERKEKLNIKVLLADDERSLAGLTSLFLRTMGCTTEIVDNGQLLVDRLKASKPGEFGLVITDFEMPVMNGMEVLAQIRGDSRLNELPIIVYSGTLSTEQQKVVEDSRGVFLQKPFTKEQLEEKVKRAIGKMRE